METAETLDQMPGLGESIVRKAKSTQAFHPKAKPLLERAQSAAVDLHHTLPVLAAARAQGAPIGDVKRHGTAILEHAAAAHAVGQLRTQPERRQRAQLEQSPQPCVGSGCLHDSKHRTRQDEEPLHVGWGSPLWSQPVENLEQIAREGEAGGVHAKPGEHTDQARVLESRHRPHPTTRLDLDPEQIEEVERTREAAGAAPGALGNRGDAPLPWGQQVHDPVRLPEWNRAQQQSLGLEGHRPRVLEPISQTPPVAWHAPLGRRGSMGSRAWLSSWVADFARSPAGLEHTRLESVDRLRELAHLVAPHDLLPRTARRAPLGDR